MIGLKESININFHQFVSVHTMCLHYYHLSDHLHHCSHALLYRLKMEGEESMEF